MLITECTALLDAAPDFPRCVFPFARPSSVFSHASCTSFCEPPLPGCRPRDATVGSWTRLGLGTFVGGGLGGSSGGGRSGEATTSINVTGFPFVASGMPSERSERVLTS